MNDFSPQQQQQQIDAPGRELLEMCAGQQNCRAQQARRAQQAHHHHHCVRGGELQRF